jgi:molybdate transport system ATP-binding protein
MFSTSDLPAESRAELRAGLEVEVRQEREIPLCAEFRCRPDELLALVGPSGSGKTTLLRCIAGLYRPATGRIVCNGAVWLDTQCGTYLPPQRRGVGLTFQHYALFPHMSAVGNVRAALGHLPRHAREARARELLALMNLKGLEERPIRALSGGQQQRVAVARSLARDPAILLLDEPFSAVDQVTRRKLQAELVQLRRRIHMPIVLVTHDLEEARRLADRLCILHRGRTLQSGPPAEIMSRPASPLVARLIDQNNVFEATVIEHRPETGATYIRWRELTLETRHTPQFPAGMRVAWVIPRENVRLHLPDRPSQGERENAVEGVIRDCISLGESTTVIAVLDEDGKHMVSTTLPTHVARRNSFCRGERVRMSFLKLGIHLMPWHNADED